MVFEILSRGAQNAIPAKQICDLLHITRQELSRTVEQERRSGKPICSTSGTTAPGYYIAADKGEMERFCRSLYHRAGEIHKTRRACLQTIEQLPEREGL